MAIDYVIERIFRAPFIILLRTFLLLTKVFLRLSRAPWVFNSPALMNKCIRKTISSRLKGSRRKKAPVRFLPRVFPLPPPLSAHFLGERPRRSRIYRRNVEFIRSRYAWAFHLTLALLPLQRAIRVRTWSTSTPASVCPCVRLHVRACKLVLCRHYSCLCIRTNRFVRV
jgi:hypothetical protein